MDATLISALLGGGATVLATVIGAVGVLIEKRNKSRFAASETSFDTRMEAAEESFRIRLAGYETSHQYLNEEIRKLREREAEDDRRIAELQNEVDLLRDQAVKDKQKIVSMKKRIDELEKL